MYINQNLEDEIVSEAKLPCGYTNQFASGYQKVDSVPSAMPNIIINVQSNNTKSEDVNEERPVVTNPLVVTENKSTTTSINGDTQTETKTPSTSGLKIPTEKMSMNQEEIRVQKLRQMKAQNQIKCVEYFSPVWP